MKKYILPNLRPIGLDVRLAGSNDPLAKAWQLLRGTLMDRGFYWGLLITLGLPAAFNAFGNPEGFAVHGGVYTAISVAIVFWIYSLVSSIILGLIAIRVIGKENKKAVRYAQHALFAASGFAFFLGATTWFPSVLTVSLLGAIVGTAAVHLVAQWSVGTCTGPDCEI